MSEKIRIELALKDRAISVPDRKGWQLKAKSVVFNGEFSQEFVIAKFAEKVFVDVAPAIRGANPATTKEWTRSDGVRQCWTTSTPRAKGMTTVKKRGIEYSVPCFEVDELFIDVAGVQTASERQPPGAALKAENEELKRKNDELEARLARLEAMLNK
jgi:hypothetical protein